MLRVAIRKFMRSDRGATAIEYGLVVAGVALVIATAVALMGNNIDGVFGWLSGHLNPADAPATAPPDPSINQNRGNVVVAPR